MTDKLNEFLAVEVMGWESSGEMRLSYKTGDFDNNGLSMRQWKSDWNPAENIEQAMMCLEKFLHWQIDCKPAGFYVHIKDEIGISHESLPLAISLACARAKGWKDE